MPHHFSFDPRTVLGVGAEATPDEIHRAFLAKSKKHHPDHGGDDWAFMMVARAHEILMATSGIRPGPDVSSPPPVADPVEPAASAEARPDPTVFPREPARTIDAELVWIRCEGSPQETTASGPARVGMTLSVCLVVSWPPAALVSHSAEFAGAAETLRLLIQTFDHLTTQPVVIDFRSRIEDGQFVGWLSYPSVLKAEAAFLAMREDLAPHGINISLRTRDEQVPIDWVETRVQP